MGKRIPVLETETASKVFESFYFDGGAFCYRVIGTSGRDNYIWRGWYADGLYIYTPQGRRCFGVFMELACTEEHLAILAPVIQDIIEGFRILKRD